MNATYIYTGANGKPQRWEEDVSHDKRQHEFKNGLWYLNQYTITLVSIEFMTICYMNQEDRCDYGSCLVLIMILQDVHGMNVILRCVLFLIVC